MTDWRSSRLGAETRTASFWIWDWTFLMPRSLMNLLILRPVSLSMPCTSVFDAQDADYKESVLPSSVTARVAVEAAVTGGWWKYVGSSGRVIGIDTFGESAPAGELFKLFGFIAENVGKAIDEVAA